MAGNTKIEWTDHTFSPWRGCQKVSPGCDHCYAEAITLRFKHASWGPGAERTLQSDKYWQQPFRWNKAAQKAGERRRVFCASMADVFDNAAPLSERQRLWALIWATPNLDWQILTKRPENMAKMLPADWGDGWPNVWLGISAEDQERYDHRWPILADVPAVVRFVSYEPALGPVSMMPKTHGDIWPDWTIVGGESGPGARPMHPDWARNARDETIHGGGAFFFKQYGRYQNNPLYPYWAMNMAKVKELDPPANGKGGALLDGRLWREFPQTV